MQVVHIIAEQCNRLLGFLKQLLISTFRISRGVAESFGDSSEEAGRDFDGFGVMPGHP
jgi:hypothetical protein